MPLLRGEVQDYDTDRMVVSFTMFHHNEIISCAVTTAAMDDIECRYDIQPDQRVKQFIRLREVIEERASCKFYEQTGDGRRVVVRSNDFEKK